MKCVRQQCAAMTVSNKKLGVTEVHTGEVVDWNKSGQDNMHLEKLSDEIY